MIYELIKLADYFPILPKSYSEPTLMAYCADNTKEADIERKRPAILICPGGGYGFLSDREAEPVALRFLSLGYNTFIQRYSVAPDKYPTSLLQLSAAVALIRAKAHQFHIDTDKIAVCGFSAGGHLACSLGVFWDEPYLRESLEIEEGSNRPNALILAYPVITSGKFAHRGSFECLLGAGAAQALTNKMSLENQVNSKVPPTFLWHTFNDKTVPVQNTLLFANALKEYEIPFELHIFPEGPHGLSLCDSETANNESFINEHCKSWISLCYEWLKLVF